jgi:hypothetical protein
MFRTVSYDNPVFGSEDSDTTFLFRFRLGASGEEGATSWKFTLTTKGSDPYGTRFASVIGDPIATVRAGTADCGDPNCQRCTRQNWVSRGPEEYECCAQCDPGPCYGEWWQITSLGICARDYSNLPCAVVCEGYVGIPRGEGSASSCDTILYSHYDCTDCHPEVCAGEGFWTEREVIGYASCNRCSQSDYVCCTPPEC